MIKNRLNRVTSELSIMWKPDQFILSFPNLPVVPQTVNLDYFHAEYPIGKTGELADSGKRNLGDDLSPIVVKYMLKQRGISLEQETDQTKHLYAIGSILLQGYQNATVWGSGFLTNPSFLRRVPHSAVCRKLDIRCVRGPRTRKILMELGHHCPKSYGDPAVLLPKIYQPAAEKKLDYVIIPHHSKEKELRGMLAEEHLVSMNTADYKLVIDKIASAEKVITSSLHGIILAETYGVPAVYYLDRPDKFHFKYDDWYASTGRDGIFPMRDWQSALVADAPPVPDLAQMQKTLVESFPYDLWN